MKQIDQLVRAYKQPMIAMASLLILGVFLTSFFSNRDTPGLNVPSEFSTIQEAIDHAQPGDVVIVDAEAGPFQENIEIKVPNIKLQSHNGRAVIEAKVIEKNVIHVLADRTNISGFEIVKGATGILVEGTFGVVVADNHIKDQFGIGIMLFEAKHSHLVNNTLSGNIHGIWLSQESDNNILLGNLVENNRSMGISLNASNNNQIKENQWLNQQTGMNISQSVTNTLSNNIVKNNETGISLNEAAGNNQLVDNEINGNTVGISMFNAHQNIFERNQISNNFLEGIVAEVTSNTEYRNNILKDNQVGIRFVNSSNNMLDHNSIETNHIGIHLIGASLNNVIGHNNIFANTNLGLSNDTLEMVNAANNYWGTSSGARLNKDDIGTSDLVAGLIKFDPWLTKKVALGLSE